MLTLNHDKSIVITQLFIKSNLLSNITSVLQTSQAPSTHTQVIRVEVSESEMLCGLRGWDY